LNNKIKTENNIEKLHTQNQSNSEIKQGKKKKAMLHVPKDKA